MGGIEVRFKLAEDNKKPIGVYFKEQKDKPGYTLEKGPNHTRTCDKDKMTKIHARINNGFRLFGRYYQNLWS